MFDPSTATVISVCPFQVTAHKPGLSPGHFVLDACKDYSKPVVLHIKSSTFPVYLDADRGAMRVNCSAWDVARSIAEDYITSSLGVTDDARPGIIFVAGTVFAHKLGLEEAAALERARQHQRNWFMNLISIADDEWQKTHRHAAISDMQRVALNEINRLREAAKQDSLKREWLIVPINDDAAKPETCPVCGTLVVNDPIICANCKYVRKVEEYDKLKKTGQFVGA